MNPPRDYPVELPDPAATNTSTGTPTVPLTFATLRDRHEAHLPITDAMIREARAHLESAYSGSYPDQ